MRARVNTAMIRNAGRTHQTGGCAFLGAVLFVKQGSTVQNRRCAAAPPVATGRPRNAALVAACPKVPRAALPVGTVRRAKSAVVTTGAFPRVCPFVVTWSLTVRLVSAASNPQTTPATEMDARCLETL